MQPPEKKRGAIKNFWVIRRVGGLEDTTAWLRASGVVIRRVGGLEVSGAEIQCQDGVIRRVGGLEVSLPWVIFLP